MKTVNYEVLSAEKLNKVTGDELLTITGSTAEDALSNATKKEIHVEEFKHFDPIAVVETEETFFIGITGDLFSSRYKKDKFTLEEALIDFLYEKNCEDYVAYVYFNKEFDYKEKIAALNLCKGHEDRHLYTLKNAADDKCAEIREVAIDILNNMKHIDVDFWQDLLYSKHDSTADFAIKKLQNSPDFTIEKLEKWLYKDYMYCVGLEYIPRVRVFLKICANRTDIPVEWYERELSEQEDCDVCLSAIKACKGRNDIPSSLIEIAKNHECEEVREAAEELMNSMNKQ